MRLWSWKLVNEGLLPKSQLLSQWRELNSIFKKQDKHILINYIYEYSKNELLRYTTLVLAEMGKRNYKINSYDNLQNYFELSDLDLKYYLQTVKMMSEFKKIGKIIINNDIFPQHTFRYLKQNFANLQEKYDRGQSDFTRELYEDLLQFICNEENK